MYHTHTVYVCVYNICYLFINNTIVLIIKYISYMYIFIYIYIYMQFLYIIYVTYSLG